MLSAASLLSSTTSNRRFCGGPAAPSLANAIGLSLFNICRFSATRSSPGCRETCLGTEFRDDPSAAVDCDDTPGPAQLPEPAMQQFTYRLLQPETAKLHHCTDVVRRDRANEILAMACRGDRADSILCIGPGSDDG